MRSFNNTRDFEKELSKYNMDFDYHNFIDSHKIVNVYKIFDVEHDNYPSESTIKKCWEDGLWEKENCLYLFFNIIEARFEMIFISTELPCF